MRRTLLPVLLIALLLTTAARAEDSKPDDRMTLDLSAEDWVTTKAARVTVSVEAAVSAANAGTMRADMIKAVNGLAAGDWRLVSFNRSQDQSGLERWSASFEARVVETSLGGLGESAKKLSKAGMQLSVANIDFSPTLDEMETVRSNLRTQLYKKAAEQLTALNGAFSGRGFRISTIDFNGANILPPMPYPLAGQATPMPMSVASISPMESQGMERSQKIVLTAHVVFAAPAVAADVKR